MKLLITLIVPFLLFMSTCALHVPKNDLAVETTVISTRDHTIDFGKEVLPVLLKNCSPCHFSGGKMYERLPFDKEATLINNVDKIMKRVEKDEKKAIVKEFLLQVKNAQTKEQDKPVNRIRGTR